MKRYFRSYSVDQFPDFKLRMLNWCNRFNICAFLDNHHYQLQGHRYECLAGCGTNAYIYANAGTALDSLQQFLDVQNDWCFGHLGYDLKWETEGLASHHSNQAGFPDLYFFVPQYVLQLNESELHIGSRTNDHDTVWKQICEQPVLTAEVQKPLSIQERVSRHKYLQTIHQLQQHILRGDCYEINYCIEFFAEEAEVDPVQVYQKLSTLSPNPFSVYYKIENSYLLCASPERFLSRKGQTLLSQPIKGTIRRNLTSESQDELLRNALYHNNKERSENVMVVDLVRNDLSRVCKEGTVQVDELFGIYSFPQVHQMISSVTGEVKDDVSFTDLIRATFPMGSMTGAPKRRVIELIEQYEPTKRGIFSGAVGYIHPTGDFDFNVVIRSIMYNKAANYLSYMVGSGITWYAQPEEEYEECLVKAAAIRNVL